LPTVTEEKSRNRRRMTIDETGIDKRRAAIHTIIDQAPPRPPDQIIPPARPHHEGDRRHEGA
jgi:hypothetical protein